MSKEDYQVRPQQSYAALLEEASEFYMARGSVYATLRRLTARLNQERIPYALIGGMALAAHGFVRMRQDVDILMRAEGLKAFRERCVGHGYVAALPNAQKTFRDAETQVRVEIITTGEFPGDCKPKPISFPDPITASVEREGLRVVSLEKLIELKLASGTSASDRLRDLADVQDLINALGLPLDLADRLDPSVREAFYRLWHDAHPAKDK
jgi:hypothetical protein